MIGEDHVSREVLVLRPEAVREPAANARVPCQDRAGVHLVQRRTVVIRQAVHRSDDCQIVDVLGHVREQVRDFDPALTVASELPRRGHQAAWIALRYDHLANAGHGFAGMLGQGRLRVEGVDLAGAAVAEDGDQVSGLGPKVRLGQRTCLWRAQGSVRGQDTGKTNVRQPAPKHVHELATIQR